MPEQVQVAHLEGSIEGAVPVFFHSQLKFKVGQVTECQGHMRIKSMAGQHMAEPEFLPEKFHHLLVQMYDSLILFNVDIQYFPFGKREASKTA